jgi:hypothetical protein
MIDRHSRGKAMAAQPEKPELRSEDARWTYRYLRIAMVGAVVLLAASIVVERTKVDCWQTSISAYYYTPVRAIFVGAMIAVALALIAYKGKGPWEDLSLNLAGMLAPVVAVAPTTDVGRCWSLPPIPLPVNDDGSLAAWVVTNIDNNIYALLIAGIVGLAISAAVAMINRVSNRSNRRITAPIEVELTTLIGLGFAALVLAVGWWLIQNWDDFYTRAHGSAAVLFFAFLIGAIVANVLEHRGERSKDRRNRVWTRRYLAVAALMVFGGILIWLTRIFEDHTVFALEAYEIALFALYWIAQTAENWPEQVETEPSGSDTPAKDAASTQPRA